MAVGEGKEDTGGSAVGAGASWAPRALSSWEPCGTGSLASLQLLAEGCSLVREGHCPWACGAGSPPWQKGWPHQQQRPSSLTGVCNEQPHPRGVSGPGRGWDPNLPCSPQPLCSLLRIFQWLPATSWMKSRLLSTADSLFRGALSYGLCKAQQTFWALLAT